MNAPSFRVPPGLIRQLPLPLVLFGSRCEGAVANERFDEIFLPGQLDHPDLRRLLRDPNGVWQPVRLRRRDGLDGDVYAQAFVVADGVLLAFDASPGSRLFRENERLRERIAELERTSGTDPLTGAHNRAQLDCVVDRETRRALRSGEPATLILLDIDDFKRVNDTCGHLVGDAVLVEFVDRIRQRIRETDQLFRWGGDEFVVLATSVALGGGAVLAEDLRRTIGSLPFRMAGSITASLGVAEYAGGESGEAWLRRTDQALYAAKRAGRNRIHVDRRASSDRGDSRRGARVGEASAVPIKSLH